MGMVVSRSSETMKSVILLLSLVGSFCTFAAQPKLPKQVKTCLPEIIYKMATNLVSIETLQQEFCNGSKWGQDKNTIQMVWSVYSDRENNITYTTPKKKEIYTKLGFGEQLFIAEIKDDMALVYKLDRPRYGNVDKGLEIPLDAKCCGWVSMENLLLWYSSPSSPCGIQKKCLICPSINNPLIRYTLSPNEASEHKSMTWLVDECFCFILKEGTDGESVLICKSNATNLCGWIKKTDILTFDPPLFLEPNWDPGFVEQHIGETANLYDSPSKENVICSWKMGEANDFSAIFYRYRMRPYQLRFPVFGTPDSDGMVECRTLTCDSISPTRRNILTTAYVQWKENDEDSFWRPVLCLNHDEILRLLEVLKPIYLAAKLESSDRTLYHNVMEPVFTSIMANSQQMTKKELDKLHPKDIYQYLYNICNQYQDKNHNHTIGEICNDTIVRNASYHELLHDFERKYHQLEQIFLETTPVE